MLRQKPAWPLGLVQLGESPSVGNGSSKSTRIIVIPCYLFLSAKITVVFGRSIRHTTRAVVNNTQTSQSFTYGGFRKLHAYNVGVCRLTCAKAKGVCESKFAVSVFARLNWDRAVGIATGYGLDDEGIGVRVW
jgi:hypothetical protein